MARDNKQDIFNACVDRLNAGEDIERIVADYPQHADDLREWLRMGAHIRQLDFDPREVASAQARVEDRVSARKPPKRKRVVRRRGLMGMAATLVLALVGVVVVVALMSRQSPNNANIIYRTPLSLEGQAALATIGAEVGATVDAELVAGAALMDGDLDPFAVTATSVVRQMTATQEVNMTATAWAFGRATSTPGVPIVQLQRGLVARQGPGPDYPIAEPFAEGDRLEIVAMSEDGRWYQVILPSGALGWVVASETFVAVSGDTSALEAVTPPPLMTATATATPIPVNGSPTRPFTPTPIPAGQPPAYATLATAPLCEVVVPDAQDDDPEGVLLRSQPAINGAQVALVRSGAELEVHVQQNRAGVRWYLVQLDLNVATFTGWLRADEVEELTECPAYNQR